MKIRDLDKYAKGITGDDDYLSKLNSPQDTFFKEMYGGTFNLRSRISEISDFAANANEQIFYELLQNASDAKATSFFVAFDESNFLALNNGLPFITDGAGDKAGRLRTFLTKKQSANFENENIGEKGQGSKLLYELITDDLGNQSTGKALLTEIHDNKKGPILLSWQDKPFQHFINWEGEEFKSKDHLNLKHPLLTKIIYTYFPALPSKDNNSYFSYQEYESLISFLRQQVGLINVADFYQGTLLYFPLGKGRYQSMKAALEQKNLVRGLSTSIALLPRIQRVKINDLLISRPQDFEGKVILESKEKIKEGKERTIFTRLFLPSSPETLTDTYNFFQFFPIVEEAHGLKFIIDSKEYKIESSRQKIDLTKAYNQRKLEEISKAVIQFYLELIKSGSFDKSVHFIKCILLTDFNKLVNGTYKKLFYEDIIEVIKQNLPTATNEVGNFENVVVKDSDLGLVPTDIGHQDMYWLHQDLKDYFQKAEEQLELSSWTAKDILEQCIDEPTRKNWVNGLNNKDYLQLVQEVIANNSKSSIQRLPFIKGSKGKLYALSDFERKYVSDEQGNEVVNTILLEKRMSRLTSILEKQDVCIGGKELAIQSFWQEFLAKNFNLSDTELFKKLNNSITTTDLERDEKWTIFTNYKTNFKELEAKLLRSDLKLFQNEANQIQPLKKLLRNSSAIAASSLLDTYQIHPMEPLHDELDDYLMKSKKIWGNVIKDWNLIQPNLEQTNYKTILSDFKTLYEKSSEVIKLGVDIDWVLIGPNVWISPADLFFNTKILALGVSDYNKLKVLVERISTFRMVDFDYLHDLNHDCFDIQLKSIANLSERVEQDEYDISKEELILLEKIGIKGEGFFTSFIINEEVNGYSLKKNDAKSRQFHTSDSLLNNFLTTTNKYFLLPTSLFLTFQKDSALKQIDESFVQKLIEAFRGEQALIDTVMRQAINVKTKYLEGIDEVSLFSDERSDSYRETFEGKVLQLINDTESQEHFRNRIIIDGQPLSNFVYRDRIKIKLSEKQTIKFSLAQLIDKGDSELLDKVKQKLSLTQQGNLFSMKDYPVEDIKEKIVSLDQLSSTQLAFLIAYDQGINIADNLDKEEVRKFDAQASDRVELLTILFDKSISNFSPYLSDSFFHPNRHIYSEKDTLLLETENIPEDIFSWLVSEKHQEKLSFLEKNGLQTDEGAIIKYRGKFHEQESTISIANEVIKNKYLTDNTLVWVTEKYDTFFPKEGKAYKSLSYLVERYIHQYKNLPSMLIKMDGVTGEGGFNCLLVDWQGKANLYCMPKVKKEEVTLVDAITKDLGLQIIDTTSYTVTDILKKNDIQKCVLNKTLKELPDDKPYEWDVDYYKAWKAEINETYQIDLLQKGIPFEFTLKYGESEYKLEDVVKRKIALEVKGDSNRILLTGKDNYEILDILSENQDELFREEEDKEKLIQLLNLARKEEVKDSLKEELEAAGVTADYLEYLKQAVSEQGLTLEQVKDLLGSSGSGGVDLGKDLTEAELSNLKENLDTVNELLAKVDKDKLDAILTHLDDIEQLLETEIDDSTPNQVIGHIGEILVFEWLKKKHKYLSTEDIQLVSIEIDEHGNYKRPTYTSYDIKLNFNNRTYFLDVKTTNKSISDLSESVAFFISRKEYKFIQENQLDNYFIIRISLADLKMSSLYKHIASQIIGLTFEQVLKKYHRTIVSNCLRFLEEERAIDTVQQHRLSFKVSIPSGREDSPF